MFHFYYRAHELAIQRAAQEDDWAKVTTLYKIDPRKNRDLLDGAICDGVISKVMSGKLRIDDLQNYLLRALTLGPVTIKLELIERLRQIQLLADLESECKLVTALAETSADIFTVMCAKNYDYYTALNHVKKKLAIPHAEVLGAFVNLLQSSNK